MTRDRRQRKLCLPELLPEIASHVFKKGSFGSQLNLVGYPRKQWKNLCHNLRKVIGWIKWPNSLLILWQFGLLFSSEFSILSPGFPPWTENASRSVEVNWPHDLLWQWTVSRHTKSQSTFAKRAWVACPNSDTNNEKWKGTKYVKKLLYSPFHRLRLQILHF